MPRSYARAVRGGDSDDDASASVDVSASNNDNSNTPVETQQTQPTQETVTMASRLRGKTRQSTTRVTNFDAEMSNQQIRQALATALVTSEVEIQIATEPLWHLRKTIGTVVTRARNTVCVKFADDDLGTIDFPLSPSMKQRFKVKELHVLRTCPLHVPLATYNSPVHPDRKSATIYVDGGARDQPGKGAAAIILKRTSEQAPDKVEVGVRAARYFEYVTSSMAEGIAMAAALKLARRLKEHENELSITVVGDSEVMYNFLVEGTRKGKDAHMIDVYDDMRTAWNAVRDVVTLARMNRRHGNPADDVANDSMNKETHLGSTDDVALFLEPTVFPPRRKVQHRVVRPRPEVEFTYDENSLPTTFEQFAAIRRLPTRGSVPGSGVELWSHCVVQHLQKVVQAPGESKETEFMRLLMLPTYFLPARASVTRVMRHMQRAEAFHLQLESGRRERSHRSEHRLSEAINRCLMEYRIRRGSRLLSSAADAPDIPHEEKVDKMKQKSLDGDFVTNIDREQVRMFSSSEVQDAIHKVNKDAANAIDGWTKDLIVQAAEVNSEIYALLADLLHWLLTAELSQFTRDCLVMSRGVGIPKPDGGVRPICVSSIFVKLLGTLCTAEDDKRPSENQYAIGTKDGAKRIVHKVKDFIQRKGKQHSAVLRFDVSNAYGTMSRTLLQKLMETADHPLRQYFRLVYGRKSHIAVFGPEGKTDFIPLGEGVKQGDATSSLLFCLGVDVALGELNKFLSDNGIYAEIYMYMDDLTICVDVEHADLVSKAAIAALNKIGFKVNEDKSKILTDMVGQFVLPRCSHEEMFIILGANIAESAAAYKQFTDNLLERQAQYFDLFKRVSLHPQAVCTLLRICGHPRIHYFCATTPPDEMKPVTEFFDQQVKAMVEQLLDPTGLTEVPAGILHDDLGFGAPHYSKYCGDIFNETKRVSLENDPRSACVPLTTRNHQSNQTDAQADAAWMFFDRANSLTGTQFSTALAIRLGVMPRKLQIHGSKCNCGYLYTTDAHDTFDHIFTCDLATPIGHSTRHNRVRDAIVTTCRLFGITVTKEPTCFTYPDGHARRPDVLLHTQPQSVAIDVSLTSCLPCGDSIKRIEKEKAELHAHAVQATDCIFYPFVMATRGFIGKRALDLIGTAKRALMPYQQRYFVRQLHHAVATAAATGRSDAVVLAVSRLRGW